MWRFLCEYSYYERKNSRTNLINRFILNGLKHIDDEQHIKLTKRTNKNILQFARFLSDNGAKMWIRHVLDPKMDR